MPAQQISQTTGEINIKEAEIEARDIVEEGEDTREEVVKKFIEHEKLLEVQEAIEQAEEEFQEDLHRTALPQQTGAVPVTKTVAEEKSEFLIQVENVLSENLGEIYLGMETGLRERFKQKGEEIARKIEEVVAKGKARIKEIIEWVKDWLKMIPGVNKFFLEQEAKIKGDKIMGMIY